MQLSMQLNMQSAQNLLRCFAVLLRFLTILTQLVKAAEACVLQTLCMHVCRPFALLAGGVCTPAQQWQGGCAAVHVQWRAGARGCIFPGDFHARRQAA